MFDSLNSPIKTRPFDEEKNSGFKQKVSLISLENELNKYKEPNYYKIISSKSVLAFHNHINFPFVFLIFLFTVFIIFWKLPFIPILSSDSNNENYAKYRFQSPPDSNFHFEILIYNSTMTFSSYLSNHTQYLSKKIGNFSFISNIKNSMHSNSDISFKSFMLIPFFLSLLFLVLSYAQKNQIICFIFVIFIFLSDKYIMNTFIPFTAVSFELILITFTIYIELYILNNNNKSYTKERWFSLIFLSMVSASICFFIRIEYLVLFVPIIVIFSNCALVSIPFLFLFLLAFFMNFLFMIALDRLIGFPSITLDSFSLNELLIALLSSDFNGLFLTSALIIPFFWPFTNYKSKENLLYFISLVFVIVFAFILHASCLTDSFLTRILIARLAVIFLLGNIICNQNSVLVSIILLGIFIVISMIFTIFKLDVVKLYHFFVNQ